MSDSLQDVKATLEWVAKAIQRLECQPTSSAASSTRASTPPPVLTPLYRYRRENQLPGISTMDQDQLLAMVKHFGLMVGTNPTTGKMVQALRSKDKVDEQNLSRLHPGTTIFSVSSRIDAPLEPRPANISKASTTSKVAMEEAPVAAAAASWCSQAPDLRSAVDRLLMASPLELENLAIEMLQEKTVPNIRAVSALEMLYRLAFVSDTELLMSATNFVCPTNLPNLSENKVTPTPTSNSNTPPRRNKKV